MEPKEKTPELITREWLNTFPEPYKTQALDNAVADSLLIQKESASQALIAAFEWEATPQGHDYWLGFYSSLTLAERSKA